MYKSFTFHDKYNFQSTWENKMGFAKFLLALRDLALLGTKGPKSIQRAFSHLSSLSIEASEPIGETA